MTATDDIRNFFFLGIGGIGMSALARYFHSRGYRVTGYDRTPSPLTQQLEAEGMCVSYEDSPAWVESCGLSPQDTLVVRTPAVPEDSALYRRLRGDGYDIRKRAEVLGWVTRRQRALCVAGTHGKTTTSTLIAHLMQGRRTKDGARNGVNAFLGGISLNYHTNVLIAPESDYVVVEADEYDRSFHHLQPYISVITAVDADHLDIYGTPEAYREAFAQYTALITGALVMKHGIDLRPRLQPGVRCYTYGVADDNGGRPDFYADHIRTGEGWIAFDFHAPGGVTIADVRPGVPVWVNIENTVAAMAVAWLVMQDEEPSADGLQALREAAASFRGVQRRFNIHVSTPHVVYIDDYAHHPQEIATAIDSVRRLYPARRLAGIFQPHLYTRTRDFADEFARVLSTLDEPVLLPIYPAREQPIEGVDSRMLLTRIRDCGNDRARLVEKAEIHDLIAELVRRPEPLVLLTIGAGDIDRMVAEIEEEVKGPRTKDQGPRTKDQGRRMKDEGK